MKNVQFTMNTRVAYVSFLSRYRDENDFEVYQDGRSGRVRQTDAGTVRSLSEHFSDHEAALAVAAHERADAAEFERWRAKTGVVTW